MSIDKIKARLGRNTQALTNQQTDKAEVGLVRKEWAEHPTSGLTPARLAEIMLNAEHGDLLGQLDLADDIEEKDGHVMAELAKRKNALLSKTWQIVPPPNASRAEQRDADMVNEILRSVPDFEDLILDMGDGILRSINNSQVHWARDSKEWYPQQFETLPARRFTVSETNPSQVLLRLDGGRAEPLWQFGWVQHRHKAKSGYIPRSGLIRTLAWPFLFKNYSVRDLAEFLEIYGLPLRLGKYPAGASQAEKSTLLQAIMSIGHNAGGIIPKGMDIEFREAAKGASDPYMAMVEWAERTQSKVILGGTLTSQADGKSSTHALGNVHNEVREELRDSDLRQIGSTLTRDLVWPLLLLNGSTYTDQRRRARLQFDTQEPEDLVSFSQAIPPLVQAGARIPAAWVNDKLKIPQPKDGEAVLGAPTGAPAPATPQSPAALRFAALKAAPPQGDGLGSFTDQLANEAGTELDQQLTAIADLVDKAQSWEEVEQALIQAYQGQGAAALAGVMQQAMAAASLAGRYDVELGN
ncbi:DUF935 domain-containing protein [Gallaecimonas kandeliae]|uniref:DUF935 domain-containing protein n=1 Tax=Gallaecimonas kandeliae TaxID=3029055 RepID=UPI00264A4A7E|nr:DUF935 domain-containing protein [Gallaecimonas kandeliae]WKE64345.1 DUF935 domain-containing protein [Gallaecimonas kandeliae]